MHILIMEDDLDLGFSLQQALHVDGISSLWLRRAADLPLPQDVAQFDCALLDLTLPDGAGLEILSRWRGAGVALPIIIITARSALSDRLAGLDGGADDFVIKPFETAELISRMHAVVRRYARQSSPVWTVGALQIEPRSRVVRLDGITLDLSPREFHLLQELARDPGAVVAKGTLAQRLEPLGDALDFSAVEVHVSRSEGQCRH